MNHKTEYIWTCKIGGPATQRHPLDVEALYELQKVMADFGGDWPDVPGEQEVVRRAKMLSRLWKADRAALAAQPGAVGKIPTVCDGKEQEAFEKWAAHNRFNLSEHPLHYLFLDPKTDAARQAWKGALEYVGRVLAAAPQAEGWVMVPVDVLKAASESLGSFVSDHGWGDADMQAMDNLDAYLAARPSAPTALEPRPCKVGGPCVATASSPCACRDLQRPQPPAQAASLTDDRILEIWFQSDAPSAEHDWRGGIVRFARALETHHGINKEAP